ncbi:ChaN family lipoprotein [Desulfuromonas sp. AOP6]|uniref:ChaN family lipoprotein n=1 Tax=Desulfuromonas sp. AOP6 TaxID=1566351 RepID=UPI0012738FB5|nr:ChaN family lipoprotein [Desulfuromonas sp. AOP6]BCA80565.1 hypothetical protein AOP6_2352 [Desulfuromonas sp. AOP6]
MVTVVGKILGTLTIGATLIMTACSPPKLSGDPQTPYHPARPPVVGDILHLPTGTFVSEEQMLTAATDARLVYVGETHDNPASHRLQLTVLQAMAERHPGRVAVGMEMFTPAQQDILDRWTTGELNEKEFLKKSRWYATWNMDFAYYRELLVFARDNRIPVVGLNADKDLVRAVGQKAFEQLDETERQRLPQIDMSDPYHRAMVEAIYGGHSQGNSMLDGFLRVQNLWDEAMAESIVRFLDNREDDSWRMMIVAGGNHVRYGYGIPRRVFRRLPTSYSLIGSRELDIPESKKDRLMDVEMPDFPMPPYDFMAFTEYEDLPQQEVKLGAMLDDSQGKVLIKGVIPGSAAAEAGLQEADIIRQFNGLPIEEAFDLIYEVKQRQEGDRATLILERGGQTLSLEVRFKALPPNHHAK